MSERINELLTLTARAQKMELVNEEIALSIYMEIFEKYTPKISRVYESAIRLLEKRDRLEEGYQICSQAIELIKEDEISGQLERFEDIARRLKRKMEEQGIVVEPPRKKSPYKSILLIFGSIILMTAVFLFATPQGRIIINLEEKNSIPVNQPNHDSTETTEQAQYPITAKMIKFAVKSIKREEEVVDANIFLDGETIGMGLITLGKNKEQGKELINKFLTYLGAAAATEYDELQPPKDQYYGEIYNFYELVISVANGNTDSAIYLKGTKSTSGSSIYYRE